MTGVSDLLLLTDDQMERLRPFFLESHGKPRVDDRRVMSGIVFVNPNGLRWRYASSAYGPHKTLYGTMRQRGPHLSQCARTACSRSWEFSRALIVHPASTRH